MLSGGSCLVVGCVTLVQIYIGAQFEQIVLEALPDVKFFRPLLKCHVIELSLIKRTIALHELLFNDVF